MKPKITVENFLQFKPSEFIASVIDDIDYVLSNGIVINMDDYFWHCEVCLAGAKLLGLVDDGANLLKKGRIVCTHDVVGEDNIAEYIPLLFDEIRFGSSGAVTFYINRIYGIDVSLAISGWTGKYYSGELTQSQIDDLKDDIRSLVKLLADAGH